MIYNLLAKIFVDFFNMPTFFLLRHVLSPAVLPCRCFSQLLESCDIFAQYVELDVYNRSNLNVVKVCDFFRIRYYGYCKRVVRWPAYCQRYAIDRYRAFINSEIAAPCQFSVYVVFEGEVC